MMQLENSRDLEDSSIKFIERSYRVLGRFERDERESFHFFSEAVYWQMYLF